MSGVRACPGRKWNNAGTQDPSPVNSPDRHEACGPRQNQDAQPRPAFHQLPPKEGLHTSRQAIAAFGGWNNVECEKFANQFRQSVFTKNADGPEHERIRHPKGADEEAGESDDHCHGSRKPGQFQRQNSRSGENHRERDKRNRVVQHQTQASEQPWRKRQSQWRRRDIGGIQTPVANKIQGRPEKQGARG